MIRNKEQTNVQESKQGRSLDIRRKALAQRDSAQRGTKSQNFLIRYLQETGDELRKVTWPTREQTFRLTTIVLIAAVVSSIVLGTLNVLFEWLAAQLIQIN